MNEDVRNTLTAFIDTPTVLNIDNTGLAPYPDDYQQADAMFDIYLNRVRFVPQHKLFSYLSSTIDPINNPSNAIYLLESGGFRFYPNLTYNNVAFNNAKLSYVHTPPNIVWGFTPDENGIPVYNLLSSTDPLWYDVDMYDIIARALALIGVDLQAGGVSQYAEMIKKEGQ